MNAYLKEIAAVCEIEKRINLPYRDILFWNDCNTDKWCPN
jgi:hypothetical protein